MRKRVLLSCLLMVLFAVGWCACVWAQTGSSDDKPVVVDIQIKGNYAVSTASVLSRIKIKPGDVFAESALNKELKRLYAMGYFSDVFVETQERPEGIVVVFTVVEKPIIGKIEFRGNARIKSDRLSKKLSTEEGVLLDFNLLARDVAEIRTSYVEEGYSKVKVDYRIETDPDTGEATVVFMIDEGYPLKIRSINFEGNESIPDDELMKYMTTKTAWWFIRKGAFDEDKFQSDLDRITSVYRSKGFLDARLTSRTEYSADGKEMDLTVVVDEGRQYLIGTVEIQGELVFPKLEIRDLINARPGDPFDYQEIKTDMDNIRALYYDRGYMNADIDLSQKYNPATDRMDLMYNIQAHEQVYVGMINIIGNTKTKDKVIRRELRVYPGEKYDGEKLKKSKERIYNLGFFEDVYFETVPTDKKDVKDLNVTVKETKTGEFSFGGGYSSVDAFLGFVQITQRNFDILNFPTFTGSGQNLTIRAELGSAKNTFLLSWTDPWIFDFPYLFGFDVYRQEHKKFGLSGYGYDEARTGGDLRLGKDITDELNTGLIYNLEEVRISDIPDNATNDLRKEAGKNWISRVTWTTTYDIRNNKYSPTKGLLTGISLENAGGFIGGDKEFLKGFAHASFYHSII
ncbi:outer membrane protein assembly factor BamA, partial [Candidatus Omnitrophota bacterium]